MSDPLISVSICNNHLTSPKTSVLSVSRTVIRETEHFFAQSILRHACENMSVMVPNSVVLCFLFLYVHARGVLWMQIVDQKLWLTFIKPFKRLYRPLKIAIGFNTSQIADMSAEYHILFYPQCNSTFFIITK